MTDRNPWQCPCCHAWKRGDVEECRCEAAPIPTPTDSNFSTPRALGESFRAAIEEMCDDPPEKYQPPATDELVVNDILGMVREHFARLTPEEFEENIQQAGFVLMPGTSAQDLRCAMLSLENSRLAAELERLQAAQSHRDDANKQDELSPSDDKRHKDLCDILASILYADPSRGMIAARTVEKLQERTYTLDVSREKSGGIVVGLRFAKEAEEDGDDE